MGTALLCSLATFLQAEMMLPEPVAIAHRGASAVAPENTASAIREAIRYGAKVIEFDIRVTSDGELVVFHDKELDRVAGRPGTIETTDWATIQTLDVGKWFTKGTGSFVGEKILRYDEAVKLCLDADVVPLIEHKTGDPADYAKVIKDLKAEDRVIVQSFDWKFLAAFREVMPNVKIGALGSKAMTAERKAELTTLRPDWIAWRFADLEVADLDFISGLGAKSAVWTVNDPEIAKLWAERGIHAVITDMADVIAAALPK